MSRADKSNGFTKNLSTFTFSNPFHLSGTSRTKNQSGNRTRFDIVFSLKGTLKKDFKLETVTPSSLTNSLVSCVGYDACLLEDNKFVRSYKLKKQNDKLKLIFESVDDNKKSNSTDKTSEAECDIRQLTIINHCSTHWNPPVLRNRFLCEHTIDWHSPVSCLTHSTNYERPCYIYDDAGNLIDLTSWVRSDGSSYNVDTSSFNNTIKSFNLNVCNEAHKSCGPNVAACYVGDKGIVESGYLNLTSISYETKEQNKTVLLTTLGQHKYSCPDNRVRTVTKFVCKNKVFTDSRPKLIKTTECENIIQWETIHACPESVYKVRATDCSINYEPQGISIDLRQIFNNASTVEVSGIKKDGKDKTMMLGLCQGIKASTLRCEGKSNSVTTSCLYDSDSSSPHKNKTNSEILGSTMNSFIKLADSRLYLESFATNKTCEVKKDRNFNATHPVGTRIEFFCSDTSYDKPKYLDYDDCIYTFEWGSKLMCLENTNRTSPITTIVNGTEHNNNQQSAKSDKELKIDMSEQSKNAKEKHSESLNDSKSMMNEGGGANHESISTSHKSTSVNNGPATSSNEVESNKKPSLSSFTPPQNSSRMNKLHKFFMIALIVMSLAGFIVVILVLDRKTQFLLPLGNIRRQARQAFQPQPVPYTRVDQFNDLDL